MLNMFETKDRTAYGSNSIKDQDYINKVLTVSFDKYLNYMATSGVFAPNTHPLVKLINSLHTDQASEIDYMYYVKSRYRQLESVMGLVTTRGSGILFRDSTSIGGDAYFISSNTDETISCKYTDCVDLEFININSDTDEFSVIEINTYKMMNGYRTWLKDYPYGSATTYVGSVILPMMNISRFKLILLNRMMELSKNNILRGYKNKLPIDIPNYSKNIDKILKEYVNQLRNKMKGKVNFGLFIERFPIVDMSDSIIFCEYLFTYKNSWLIPYCRFGVLVWFLDIVKDSGSDGYNKSDVADVLKLLKRLRSGYIFPPKDLPYIFKESFNVNLELLEEIKK